MRAVKQYRTRRCSDRAKRVRGVLLALLFLAPGACGFQPRGSDAVSSQQPPRSVYLKSAGAETLAAELERWLRRTSVKLTESPQQAEYLVVLSDGSFERKVLSVATDTGKVEEYQVLFRARLEIVEISADRRLYAGGINVARDYVYGDRSVLGREAEEDLLKRELVEQAAAQVFRHVEAALR